MPAAEPVTTMGSYFGTDGIRGAFGSEHMNEAFARRLGSALGRYLFESRASRTLHAVIGRDTRLSGPALADALTQGLTLQNVYVHDLGIVPTPAVSMIVRERGACLGVAVTASHNPASDNGIKLFDANGCKFTADEEQRIERFVDRGGAVSDNPAFRRSYPFDGAGAYIHAVRSLMHQHSIRGWKIVLDTANGATCETSAAVFRQLGAELVRIGDDPDGDNINRDCGSEHPGAMCRAVVESGAQLGIAHDGDGDRVVVCDERGELVDGDILLGLFGLYALRSSTLKGRRLVATVQSNLGLDRCIEAAGGSVERTAVGDRNVAERMRATGSNIGGESSGHIILSDFAATGDGLLAAVKLVELMNLTGRPLSELRREVGLFPLATRNLRVAAKPPLEHLPALRQAIAAAEAALGADGRVLVRYSGTEPKLRLLVEGRSAGRVAELLDSLDAGARADLEVISG